LKFKNECHIDFIYYSMYIKYTSVYLLNSFLLAMRYTLFSSPVVALLRFLAQRSPQVENTVLSVAVE